MRCLKRNASSFYYALFKEKKELFDEYGNISGEHEIIYHTPVEAHGNVSGAQGEVQSRQFGESVDYDKVILLDNPLTPIDEYSVLWVDAPPILAEDGSTDTPHDYIVKKVARTLNSTAIAIRKVNVK